MSEELHATPLSSPVSHASNDGIQSIMKHDEPWRSKIQDYRSISFETANIAPVTEKYRNFLNGTRRKDIDSYNRLSNPYYLAPSFNKPFINYDFKTPNYHKVEKSNVIIVLLKLHLEHGNQEMLVVDELDIKTLKNTLKHIAKENDEIYVLSVVNKFDIDYKQKFFISEKQLAKSKKVLTEQIIPIFFQRILPDLIENKQELGKIRDVKDFEMIQNLKFTKNFKLGFNLIFDINTIYTLESVILEYEPSFVVLSNPKNVQDSSSKKSKKFLNIFTGSSVIISYCLNKLSLPIVIFNNHSVNVEHAMKHDVITEYQSLDTAMQEGSLVYEGHDPTPTPRLPSNNDRYYLELLKSVPLGEALQSSEVSTPKSLSPLRSNNSRNSRIFGGGGNDENRHSLFMHSLSPFKSHNEHLYSMNSNDSTSSAGLQPFKSADSMLLGSNGNSSIGEMIAGGLGSGKKRKSLFKFKSKLGF